MNEKINKLIDYSKKGILSKVILKNDKVNITLFCMAEGTDMSEHTSNKAGTVYVVEGDGVFNLAGEYIAMQPNTIIYMPENSPHSLKATENTSFVLTLVD